MQFKDYYEILGVATDADLKAIKTSYRKLARQYHPDVSQELGAEERFKEVTEAYEVLKDASKRSEYDQLRHQYDGASNFQPPPGWQSTSAFHEGSDAQYAQGFSDFFESLFGGGHGGGFADFRDSARRGSDVEVELPVFLEETLGETTKTITYELPQAQEDGRITLVSKKLNIKIPVGVIDGERIRVPGQASPGIGDAPSGDLYLSIRLVPHPLFDVEGHDLIITVPIAPWEAALGTKVNIPTLDGEITMTVPTGTQTGSRLRVRGKGLAGKQGRGDLYAVLKVVMPDRDGASIDEQWRMLAISCDFDARANWRD